jgi:hypothetical protein
MPEAPEALSASEGLAGKDHPLAARAQKLPRWLHEVLFSAAPSRSGRWMARLLLLTLFFGGAVSWYGFLNGGRIDFTRHDWVEAGHRYAFLRDAARKGVLPLHMPGMWALRNVTDRFASVADTNLSPHLFLLRFMGPGRFILLNSLMLYGVGFLGLILLRRRFRLSVLAFIALFLLLFFNGHIVAHVSVGHSHWAAYFLVPYFLWLVFEVAGGNPRPWRWALFLSLYVLTILLQGAFHLFTASAFFLALLALVHPARFGLIGRGVIAASLLGAVRIVPPLLHAGEYDTSFLSGFSTVEELSEGLLHLVPPIPEAVFRNNPLNPLGWWEMDYFIGVTGLVFLAAFVAYLWQSDHARRRDYARLLLPVVVMTAFTLGRTYKLFHDLGVPLLSTQRVSTRILFLPLGTMILLGVIGLQRWLDRRTTLPLARVGLAGGVVILGADLWTHFDSWRIEQLPKIFGSAPVDLTLDTVANHPDLPYFAAITAGLLISVITFAGLVFLAGRESRRTGDSRVRPSPRAAERNT